MVIVLSNDFWSHKNVVLRHIKSAEIPAPFTQFGYRYPQIKYEKSLIKQY